jgi:hypothetical protein
VAGGVMLSTIHDALGVAAISGTAAIGNVAAATQPKWWREARRFMTLAQTKEIGISDIDGQIANQPGW